MTKEDLIIARLDRIEGKLDSSLLDVAGLKVKAGVWGALAGLVPVLLGLAIWGLSVVGGK